MSKASDYAKLCANPPQIEKPHGFECATGPHFYVNQAGGLDVAGDKWTETLPPQFVPHLIAWLKETFED
jgi:hypothetical protein